jgi:hypothetical protein
MKPPRRQKRAHSRRRLCVGPIRSLTKARAPDNLGRRYSALAKTLLASRRENLAAWLGRLRDSGDSRSIAGGAFDFRRYGLRFQLLHGDHFFEMTETSFMSLCRTDCSLRLSHLRVTPAQFFSVTVAWSFLSSRQQTRAPTFNNLDWEPVIGWPFRCVLVGSYISCLVRR